MNYIKTSEVFRQPYPLQIKSSGPHRYFMNRETWGWTDFLMNPMVNMKAKLNVLNEYNTVLICSRSNIFIWARKHSQKGSLVLQVMMMVLPLLIIVLLPKVVNTNDPEMRKVSSCYVVCIVWNSYRMIHILYGLSSLHCFVYTIHASWRYMNFHSMMQQNTIGISRFQLGKYNLFLFSLIFSLNTVLVCGCPGRFPHSRYKNQLCYLLDT